MIVAVDDKVDLGQSVRAVFHGRAGPSPDSVPISWTTVFVRMFVDACQSPQRSDANDKQDH